MVLVNTNNYNGKLKKAKKERELNGHLNKVHHTSACIRIYVIMEIFMFQDMEKKSRPAA